MFRNLLSLFSVKKIKDDIDENIKINTKRQSELDFWINVWDKTIVDEILLKNKLKSKKSTKFEKLYTLERERIAKSQLSGILWMAKKPSNYLNDKSVVEIGPGCCCALEVSKAKIKIAVEPLAEQYRDNNLLLKDNTSVTYLTGGSENIPLLSNSIDIVVASNCLDHVENIKKTISEIHRILKPDGEIFLNIEIDHMPTECEPYSFKFSDVIKLFNQFDKVFITKTKKEKGRVWVRAVFRK